MEKISVNNIVDKIIQEFPEYRNSSKYFDDENKNSPYIVLGNLTLMAFENLDNKKEILLAEKLVKFSDIIINDYKSDTELVNLFQVEVFESLVRYKTGAFLARQYLHGESTRILEDTLKFFSTDRFIKEYRA